MYFEEKFPAVSFYVGDRGVFDPFVRKELLKSA